MANPFTIASAAYDVGLRSPVALAQATAIALAESGGNERAHNRVPPDDSYGLWQINMYGELGPARRAQFGIASNEALFDIATNAKAMHAISSGGASWRPWTTFQGARYWFFYPAAQGAATAVLAARGAGAAGEAARGIADGVTEPISDVASAAVEAAVGVRKAAAWLSDRNNWFRVAKVIVGASLVAMGVQTLAAVAGGKVYDATAGFLAKPVVGALMGKGKGAK